MYTSPLPITASDRHSNGAVSAGHRPKHRAEREGTGSQSCTYPSTTALPVTSSRQDARQGTRGSQSPPIAVTPQQGTQQQNTAQSPPRKEHISQQHLT